MNPIGSMEAVVIVAISVLAFLFAAASVTLIVLCCHRYCRMLDLQVKRSVLRLRDTRRGHNISLVSNAELPNEDYEVELKSVYFSNEQLSDILKDEKWVDDATGLIPHCLEILKTCHDLTEKLVAMTIGNTATVNARESSLGDIVVIAKRISPRVDDVVKCLYPPIDPRLIEARSAALLLSVQNLVLTAKYACKMPFVEWIDSSLSEMEHHLQILREASIMCDSRTCSISSGTESSSQPQDTPLDELGAVGPAVTLQTPYSVASVL
ncbi:Transmembrane protein 98 [Holothuria leucospilota]|uniref:Transmembrane protein 98 n=1 Tax=Holothuria leucospilota TaxID=206669 RepID=A0A9Q0YMJ2_HOLLE|nr:Transmembrane protein 98 [Holothuria leucospilota]